MAPAVTLEIEIVPPAHGGGFIIRHSRLGVAVEHRIRDCDTAALALRILSRELATLDEPAEDALHAEIFAAIAA